MSNEIARSRSSLTPLILRLAVAGALSIAGVAQLQRGSDSLPLDGAVTPPVKAELPDAVQTPTETLPTDEGTGITEKIGTVITDQAKQVISTTVTDESGVAVTMDWQHLTGWAELSFAAVLLLGVFTRLASFIGAGAAVTGSLAGMGAISSDGMLESAASIYQANPLALMLLGAICLTLLCSGSGPLSLDRLLFGRRKSVEVAA